MSNNIPVITIDGPSGSGKGTLALHLANHLGWHYLDSGVLYRVLGLLAQRQAINVDDAEALAEAAASMAIRFQVTPAKIIIFLHDDDVTTTVRTEKAGEMASKVSHHPEVRQALMTLQRGFRKAPGLVTDGRDMGTVVFPDAPLKIFLDAAPEIRAQRRYQQLQAMGVSANLDELIAEITERDQRDRTRAVSPLKPADDAIVVDSSTSTIDEVFSQILSLLNKL